MRWIIEETMECECGNLQDDQHLLLCGMANTNCERGDPSDKENKTDPILAQKEI